MRKILFFLLISFLFLAGCNDGDEQESAVQDNEINEEESTFDATEDENDMEGAITEDTELNLQLTRADEEAGVALDSELYSVIDQLLLERPDAGTPNDFSVLTVDMYSSEAGRGLVMLGINRTPIEMTNISFDLSLGTQEEFVLENLPITLTEEEMGVFPSNGAMPFILDLSDAEAETLLNISEADILFSIDNFEYEEVK